MKKAHTSPEGEGTLFYYASPITDGDFVNFNFHCAIPSVFLFFLAYKQKQPAEKKSGKSKKLSSKIYQNQRQKTGCRTGIRENRRFPNLPVTGGFDSFSKLILEGRKKFPLDYPFTVSDRLKNKLGTK